MATITNKTTEIALRLDKESKPVYATFGDLLLLTINMAPQQGFSITDIKARLKLASAIEAGKGDDGKIGEIIIEAEELSILKTSFDAFKWAVIHKDIVELSDILTSLK